MTSGQNQVLFAREYWVGDSRDGVLVNGDGYHFFKIMSDGLIIEAFEVYENEEGEEVITPLPEMQNVGWIKDFGFENMDELDLIDEKEFQRIKKLSDSHLQA